MSDCVFCAIVAGDVSAAKVSETAELISFLDTRPLSRGHTLVVPKRHAARLAELDPAVGGHMFMEGQRIAGAARTGLGAVGANLVLNDGREAFQTVDHVHLHVLPRFGGDKPGLLRRLLVRRPRTFDDAAAELRAALVE